MTKDAYDWEDIHKFQVHVLAGIYVWGSDDAGQPTITCGFLEDDNNVLTLPSQPVTHEQYAAQVAVELFRKFVAVDPRMLDIVPYGFCDPIKPPLEEDDMAHRTIHLCYKTRIHPGTPVHPDLRFMTHEEIAIARPRITRGHYEAYRAGLSG